MRKFKGLWIIVVTVLTLGLVGVAAAGGMQNVAIAPTMDAAGSNRYHTGRRVLARAKTLFVRTTLDGFVANLVHRRSSNAYS